MDFNNGVLRMADLYPILDGGEELIAVSDGEFTTDKMSANYGYGECYIAFYEADGETLATPTAGTIEFSASVFDGQWLAPPANASIDAADVVPGDASYTPPSFNSVVRRTRVTLSGVTGASFFRAYAWRSGR